MSNTLLEELLIRSDESDKGQPIREVKKFEKKKPRFIGGKKC